jgi:hypothetical protein
MYADCNRGLDEADTNQLAINGSEAEWQPTVKDKETPDSQYISQSRADQ